MSCSNVPRVVPCSSFHVAYFTAARPVVAAKKIGKMVVAWGVSKTLEEGMEDSLL
jgi:hypothetical protein